jgi:hypothetical protein
MTEYLSPGDRVWFGDYGAGVVQSVSPLFVWIQWEKVGLLHHDPSFVHNLRRL